jgi:transposase
MVTMSQKEFQRVKVIENAAGGRLSVREASRLLQLSERQVQRLKRRYRSDSIGWVQHGNRGRSMPWAVSLPQKQLILSLARGKYHGFNDSHLCEKLQTEENLAVSRETVRRILRASKLEAENTLGYLRALRTLITAHGIPLSLYRDRHSIFQRDDSSWTLAEQLAGKQAPTQLGRALEQLGIEQIPAYSPQAKGRIERAWRTCQDRLISELRLARATTLSQANAVLARFCADYNQRFARPAADAASDFRPLPRRFDLARCLGLHYQRTVGADHTITLGAHSIALPPLPGHRGYARETVELSHHLEGTLHGYRGNHLLLALPLPLEEHAERRPAPLTIAQKRKNPIPRIYNLSGRPALAAVT